MNGSCTQCAQCLQDMPTNWPSSDNCKCCSNGLGKKPHLQHAVHEARVAKVVEAPKTQWVAILPHQRLPCLEGAQNVVQVSLHINTFDYTLLTLLLNQARNKP